MTFAAYVLLLAIAVPAVAACAYLLLLTLLSQQLEPMSPRSRTLKFDLIVPAHNEASVIERTVSSLRKIDWPADRFRILVIADNCTDATAALARLAGATVLERHDASLRGKGYALNFAFRSSREHAWADAVIVVDADAEVSSNLVAAFAARIEGGVHAIQAHYGILNPLASWRTRLITIAKASFHIVRSRARERMKLSCGIRGNGWCVTHELLKNVPYQAYSLTEDLEYGIDIGLAGFRVAYVDEAHSNAEMVTDEKTAGTQRRRWEDGRFQLIRSRTIPLLLAAIRRADPVCFDLALDLMVLPLSYVTLNVLLLLGSALIAAHWRLASFSWVWVALACAMSLLAYVLRGWQLSGIGARGVFDLARAPVFLLWKVILMLRPRTEGWVRTDREK
ncbi:MAG TPA: glycosyltransferase family 2 protein [Steroidobacteraceae bacterium]|nr:glycosyltransferase family 2 protein [Steroidobacteraceae bacterium]